MHFKAHQLALDLTREGGVIARFVDIGQVLVTELQGNYAQRLQEPETKRPLLFFTIYDDGGYRTSNFQGRFLPLGPVGILSFMRCPTAELIMV